ncbi:hypothetical protein PGB90_003664 [Kerria lacca]
MIMSLVFFTLIFRPYSCPISLTSTISCRSSPESVISAVSSAYRILLTYVPFILIPTSASCKASLNISSAYILNSKGDKMQP